MLKQYKFVKNNQCLAWVYILLETMHGVAIMHYIATFLVAIQKYQTQFNKKRNVYSSLILA